MRKLAAPMASLALHLGPLAPWLKTPGHRRDEVTLDGPRGPLRALKFWPAKGAPRGAYLISPGHHHDGPSDPRFEAFCQKLAGAGFLVLAPFLPDAQALRVAPTAAADLDAAFGALDADVRALGLPPPAIFSISFGSRPAAEVAARRGDRVGALVLFGGYADFSKTVRFAASEAIQDFLGAPSDPLNHPAVFLNILPFLGADHEQALADAWMLMVRRTWGRMELKRPGARQPFADQIAAGLPPRARELFLVGCGLSPGGAALVEQGLARAGHFFDFADPRPWLKQLRTRVVIAHGRNDDVIPYTEAASLAEALPHDTWRRVYLTGFFDHTGAALPRPREVLREATTLGALVRALAAAPQGLL